MIYFQIEIFRMEKKWKAGSALNKTEKWKEVVEIHRQNRLPVRNFAMEAIELGEMNIFHSAVTRANKNRKCKFNNKEFENYQALVEEYKAKEDCNYMGAKENAEVCRKMIADYTEKKICREIVDDWELKNLGNYINAIDEESSKSLRDLLDYSNYIYTESTGASNLFIQTFGEMLKEKVQQLVNQAINMINIIIKLWQKIKSIKLTVTPLITIKQFKIKINKKKIYKAKILRNLHPLIKYLKIKIH